MERDRLFLILRWVISPIAIAAITGYYESRVRGAKEQTKASYETLAPAVEDLQDRNDILSEKVAVLTGRLEELSKRAPCAESTTKKIPAPKLTGIGALGGKTEVTVDIERPPASPRKVPARFDDMIQQKAVY